MYEYKVIKGTRRTLYLKGLKSRYFYFFCFIGGIGALGLVLTRLNGGLILHLFYALVFVIALYAFFFWLSLKDPLTADELRSAAMESNVAVTSGRTYYFGPGGENKIRLVYPAHLLFLMSYLGKVFLSN